MTAAASEPPARPAFGTSYTSERQAERIRDVRSGRQIIVPARRIAACRVGEVLKRAVRQHRAKRGRRPQEAA